MKLRVGDRVRVKITDKREWSRDEIAAYDGETGTVEEVKAVDCLIRFDHDCDPFHVPAKDLELLSAP